MPNINLFHEGVVYNFSVTGVYKTKFPKIKLLPCQGCLKLKIVLYTPVPIHVGPFGKCSLWDDYTSSHSAAARLAAGRLSAFIAEKITRGLYSSKIKQVTSNQRS